VLDWHEWGEHNQYISTHSIAIARSIDRPSPFLSIGVDVQLHDGKYQTLHVHIVL
jgi:hypothetical protein